MAAAWPEVEAALNENRRELTLHGSDISQRIEKSGIDPHLYELSNLNHLDISQTCLSSLGSGLGNLVSLSSLILHNNSLKSIPAEIGMLKKLKTMNLSTNQIESVPEEIATLEELQSLNISMNCLTSFPNVGKMTSLHVLNLSNNNLESLPEELFNSDLMHLSQILASNNSITELSADVSELSHLNALDLSNNKLDAVPLELGECPKLKDLNLKGNKFKDRRFGKLVDQCLTKAVLDYLMNLLKKEREKSGGKKGKEKDKKRPPKKGKKEEDSEEYQIVEVLKNTLQVLHFPTDSEAAVTVRITPAVLAVRPYIVCCVIRQLDMQKSLNIFKHFITLQTRLHDTVCQKRQASTIATHDMRSVKLPLTYDARNPEFLMITPLFKTAAASGRNLVGRLRKEAEDLRKEKKRNTLSGIHKYLDLLKGKLQYPCLIDSEDTVISFPPITNSDKTKISKETTDILVEVTSSTSLDVCKATMDELLLGMLEMGLGAEQAKGQGQTDQDAEDEKENAATSISPSNKRKNMVVEQVKVVDLEGSLRVIYPSRVDLQHNAIEVIRDYD